MSLFIKPLLGEMFSIFFSIPIVSIYELYRYIQLNHYPNVKLRQITIFHNENIDLSQVKEGCILDIFISDSYDEKWISNFYIGNKEENRYIFQNSCIGWYDEIWKDPCEDPPVLNSDSLKIYILMKEDTLEVDNSKKRKFAINYNFFRELYCPKVVEN